MMNINEFAEIIIQRANDNLPKDNRVVGFAFDLAWGNRIRNSHDCPKSGVTNFTGREKFPDGTLKPSSYQGWQGRVWIRYCKDIKTVGSGPLEGTGLHTGTGGFGHYNGPWHQVSTAIIKMRIIKGFGQGCWTEVSIYSWDCRVFADDFPELLEQQQLKMIDEKLSGATPVAWQYRWTDPEVEKQDFEILQMYKDLIIKKSTSENFV